MRIEKGDDEAYDVFIDQPDIGEWPEPKPINAELLPVPVFEVNTMLPEVLANWVADEAKRMCCPPEIIAAAVLVELGTINGARCAIRPKTQDTWCVIPNLWGAVVSPPASKKTPAINAAMKPLEMLIQREWESHQSEIKAYDIELAIYKAQKDAAFDNIKRKAKAKDAKSGLREVADKLQELQGQAPIPPKLRRFKTNDTTIEKLGELLQENPAGMQVMRDELTGLLSNLDRPGREGERAFYLEGWNGNASYDTDRIGRGSIFIPNHCISVFGGIQPDKLTFYLEQSANFLNNDGLLQRFQVMVYPDAVDWEWRDIAPNKEARESAFAVFSQIADCDPVDWGASPSDEVIKFPHFGFDDEAEGIFSEWCTELHKSILASEDNPLIAQHLSKYEKLLPALALIFHMVSVAVTGFRGPVSKYSVIRAAAWCDFLEAHARRCYGLLADDGLKSAQALAVKLKKGKLPDGFTGRDVRRNQWRYLTKDTDVQAALDWLEDEHWLRVHESGGTGPGSGRPTLRYFINPKVRANSSKGGQHG